MSCQLFMQISSNFIRIGQFQGVLQSSTAKAPRPNSSPILLRHRCDEHKSWIFRFEVGSCWIQQIQPQPIGWRQIAKSLIAMAVDVEGVGIFPGATHLLGVAVTMNRCRSINALHVRVQAAPKGNMVNTYSS